ncbi:sigma-70 family RNA polymerase sigma factor [uncultured Paludibaculum sp.]|uniref:sigma-70 family RNA polymerase sigma factor n=1 Tax=uncultured Paludibaculum sp. TaxID=1765020 RepID=UPI002AAA9A87|nr:sigma-70 family RNA polymerase sigma factor [uncultured Paludibaculum sp.]
MVTLAMPVTAAQRVSGNNKPDQPSDAALAQRCRLREVSAFEELFRSHSPRMKSVAWNLLRRKQDAEDAVQETFLKAYRHIDSFHGHCSLASWLFRILVNTCRDMASRHSRRFEHSSEELDLHSGPRTDPTVALVLEQVLTTLSPILREVFLLAESEGFSHPEIASILDIEEGTSRTRLFEARRQLRQALRTRREEQ